MFKILVFAMTIPLAAGMVLVAGQLAVPSAAPATTMAASDRAALQAREDIYTAAVLHKDVQALDSVLAETFVDTGADGSIAGKAARLKSLATRTTAVQSLQVDQERVDFYAPATAVVTERFQVAWVSHGKRGKEAGRATDVWVRQKGAWMCVAAHSSVIH